ncbi:PH domain-containing protein [Candidatus Nanohalococcus occultus]|uniref:Membrane protein YdbS, contains bPH2 domain n=1 Tax=Candidatus Nanohalococcus occultus TaxID=2978047 RepID=A0ABY8CKB5_9ARCH|nr:putative membrane protein YdbS, contains bPH2 domain [Candidatus Nanohaloarchaeota archaeon SVXNc]
MSEKMNKPEKRLLTVWRLEVALFVLLVGATLILIPYAAYNQISTWVLWPPAVIIAIGLLGGIYMKKRYDAWNYQVREDHLYLEHGVFKKVSSMVPFVRIQHVDAQRGVIDRIAGLSKVVVYTAGTRGADVRVPGLLPEDAERLQEKLRDVAIESEDRDAV